MCVRLRLGIWCSLNYFDLALVIGIFFLLVHSTVLAMYECIGEGRCLSKGVLHPLGRGGRSTLVLNAEGKGPVAAGLHERELSIT